MRRFIVPILVFVYSVWWCDFMASAQSNVNDVAYHLSDNERRIVLGCEAIYSSSFEPKDIARIFDLYNEYNIPTLQKLAEMRQQRMLDPGDKLASFVLSKVLECIEIRYNKNISYESVYIRLLQGMLCHDESLKIEILDDATDKAHKLSKIRDGNFLYEELVLFSKILYIANSTDVFGPTKYEDFLLSLLELLNLYEQKDIHSFLRQEIGVHVTDYISYLNKEGYSDFCIFVSDKIKKNNGSLYRDISVESLLQASKEETLFRKKSDHPDLLIIEAELCLYKIINYNNKNEVSKALDDLQELWEDVKEYYGDESYMANYLAFYHSIFSIRAGNKDPEFTDAMRKELAEIRKWEDEDPESYLWVLCNAFGTFVNENPEVASVLFLEIEVVADKIRLSDDYGYFTALCNKLYLQRCSVAGYEDAFEELKHLLDEYRKKRNDWCFVNIAKIFLHSLLGLYGNTAEPLNLSQIVYDAESKLLSNELDLQIFSGINYANNKINTFIAGEDVSFEKFLRRLDSNAEIRGINRSQILMLEAIQSVNKGNKERGIEYLRGAIDCCPNAEMSILLYSTWMNLFAELDFADKEITRKSIESLDSLFETECDDVQIEHMDGYYILAQYYANRNELSKCYRILKRCYDYYHDKSIVPDYYYTTFAVAMLQLYARGYGNLEQCRLLLNDIQYKLDRVKAFVDYGSYLTLLRYWYDLAEYKSPYDYALLFTYFSPLIQAYTELFSINNYSEDVLWMHLPYVFVKISNMCRVIRYMKYQNTSGMYNQIRSNFIKQLEPILDPVKRMCKNAKGHVKLSNNYYSLLMGLGQLYEYLIDDQKQADYYYKIMKEHGGIRGQIWYMGYLIRRGLWKDALLIADAINPIVDKEIKEVAHNEHNGSYSELVSMMFSVYFKNGIYGKAYSYASQYMQLRKDAIKYNFDYFTTQERENFIEQGGAGGGLFFALLEYMEGEINETSYDAALQEKGLLLRSSERVHNAIINSGNNRLIMAIDSIHCLTLSLQSFSDDINMSAETMNLVAGIRSKLDYFERFVSTETAKYRDGSEVVPSWTMVRDVLRKDEIAIEFVHGDSAIHALIVTPKCKRPHKTTVISKSDFSMLSTYFNDQSNITENMQKLYDEEANRLYHMIWEPLEQFIGNAKNIFYSPTGILSTISFNALQLDDGSYLIDHYNLKQLSTTANLVRRNQKKQQSLDIKSAAVLGGLCYDEIQLASVNEEVSWAKKSNSPVIAQREALQSFDFLPFSYIEKDNIYSTLKNINIPIVVKSLMDAKEADIRDLLEKKPEILHISTHGFSYTNINQIAEIPYFVNRGQPSVLNCAGLALSGANLAWEGEQLPKETDNILTADEISTFDLRNTKLAVLSACNTALGTTSNEGVMGLQRGLKQAGVETLCLSLWSVNDASSSMMMSRFYENWLQSNLDMSSAMREAMLKQRSITPSPYFWAPFILIDDIQ